MTELLVVGHVTRDVIDGANRLGGAASYVSLAAVRLGATVRLVTAAPKRFALMEPLRHVKAITIELQEAKAATAFALDYSGVKRRVRLLERASSILKPSSTAPFVYLAPVIGEVPQGALAWFPESSVVVGLQGWMRSTDANGYVFPIDPPPVALLASAKAITFSEHDHPRAEELARGLARSVPVVVLTRGARGSTLFASGETHEIAAAPANELDPTGAGDVFGAALTVALARGAAPVDAAKEAAYAAARAVEGPGLGSL